MVDASDSKSDARKGRVGSSPTSGTFLIARSASQAERLELEVQLGELRIRRKGDQRFLAGSTIVESTSLHSRCAQQNALTVARVDSRSTPWVSTCIVVNGLPSGNTRQRGSTGSRGDQRREESLHSWQRSSRRRSRGMSHCGLSRCCCRKRLDVY